MSILTANLKHLYQRPLMWYWHFILIIIAIPTIILPWTSSGERSFSMYLIASVFLGMIYAGMQQEILTKPFSFCLPGHRKTLRRYFFLIGIVVNSLSGLIFLKYPGIDMPYNLIIVCSACFMGMAAYLLVVWITFLGHASFAYIGFLPLVVIGLEFMGIEVGKILEYVIVSLPFYVVIICFVFCVFVWRWLGRDSLARGHCDKVMLGIFDNIASRKRRMYVQTKTAEKRSQNTVAFNNKTYDFFLQRMERHVFPSAIKYIWGHALMLQDKFLNLWSLGFLVTILLAIIFLGYIGTGELRMIDVLFILPISASFNFNLLPYGSVLLPGGRKEKYYASVVLAFSITLLIVVIAVTVEALSILFAEILPPFNIKGQIYSYQPMHIEYLLACLLLMPIGFVCATLIPKNYIFKLIITTTLLIVFVFFWRLVVTTCIWLIPVLILIIWTGSLIILLYHCMRRSLVVQGG